MKTYIITNASGGSSYNISAASYEYDDSTGRHIFRDADGNIVANLLNVSVRLQTAA
jgi:hypothetical protein